ncbi:MAG: FAD binding domain-containing protein [Terriglobia bacterium]
MKPPPFDYFAPSTTEEAISLLGEYAERAKILAGGQSLVPLLNFRLARPQVLVDINRIQQLSYIVESEEGLRIGALTRHRALETSPLVQAKCPILAFAARFIGHLAIRNRGTFGGSLAHADPAAEFPVVLAALGSRISLRSPRGERSLSPEEFFLSYLTTALQPPEILVEAWVPTLGPRTGWGFQELALQQGAFALVAVAALITLDERGVCREARIALGSVAPVPVRAKAAENLLRGEKPNPKLLAEAARLVTEVTEPTTDIHASAEYRTAMAEVYARRALQDAWTRARPEG